MNKGDKSTQQALNDLWDSTPSTEQFFQPAQVAPLPVSARRYLEHAIAPGTRLASSVRLRMHGEIKLRGWLPFAADQVIRRDRGMIWSATVQMRGLTIRGSDSIVDGVGEMHWKLFGVLPVMTASGSDVTRSAVGRLQIESIWLPSALCSPWVAWTEADMCHPHARFTVYDETAELDLAIENSGRLLAAHLPRWGAADGETFHYREFGGIFTEERTFDGYTIPTNIRVGWDFGQEPDNWTGEFFRATIDQAEYR